VCRKLGMSRQNYYARRKWRQRWQVDAELVVQLVRSERQLQPRLGTRKLRVLLRRPLAEAGVQLGRDRFFEVLRGQGLLLAPRRSENPRTTQSYHTLPVFKNLTKGHGASRPNEAGRRPRLEPASSGVLEPASAGTWRLPVATGSHRLPGGGAFTWWTASSRPCQ